MRRIKQALSEETCLKILDKNTHGVLALAGKEGKPYALPISYVRVGSQLCFHCAKKGHKIDLIEQNPQGSFCVVEQDQIVEEKFTTKYVSVIASGPIHIETDRKVMIRLLQALCAKYSASMPKEAVEKEIADGIDAVCLLVLDMEEITGKQSSEFLKENQSYTL